MTITERFWAALVTASWALCDFAATRWMTIRNRRVFAYVEQHGRLPEWAMEGSPLVPKSSAAPRPAATAHTASAARPAATAHSGRRLATARSRHEVGH